MIVFFLPDSEEKLQRLVDEVKEASEERGLKINTKKMEVLGITKRRQRLRVQIYIGGRHFWKVQCQRREIVKRKQRKE